MLALHRAIANAQAELDSCTDPERRRFLENDIWNLERDADTHYE